MKGNGHYRAKARAVFRWAVVATLVPIGLWFATPPAQAAVSSANATTIANDLAGSGTSITSAALTSPAGTPDGIANSSMADFPTDGSDFAILTTGDVNQADDPQAGNISTDLGGANARGDTDFDVSILDIAFEAGAGMNCLSFDFRFFTEEFPEAVGLQYNDAFIAELDTSDWTTSGSNITAPHNFAFDPNGDPISVNATGNTSMSAGPSDTAYDGATPLLTAAHSVTPGSHHLFLSIFDQGLIPQEDPLPPLEDHLFDSAVFLDNFVVGHVTGDGQNGQCLPGAAPKQFAIDLTPATGTSPVGNSHQVTATVTEVVSSLAAPSGNVLFSVAGANTNGGSNPLDGSSQANYSYVGNNAGADTITGCFDADGSTTCDPGEPFATVAMNWTAVAASPTPPGDGNGGLPITGQATGLIAGVGVVALALGAAGYWLVRRRRIRFTSE